MFKKANPEESKARGEYLENKSMAVARAQRKLEAERASNWF